MIRTYKCLIREVDEEIAMYEQAKTTGVFITREVRNMIKEVRQDKESDENER